MAVFKSKTSESRKMDIFWENTFELQVYLTIGSCFSVHYRVMEHAGGLESTKEA